MIPINPERYLDVSIAEQRLRLIVNGISELVFQVSTARNGPGEKMGSECTPTGWHRIRAKIGANLPLYSVFVGRRATGEIYTKQLGEKFPQRDWILTRILWLGGLEPGKNRYGSVDSSWRYIYLHGCPDHLMQGKPESHGCIRMFNQDIVQLFDTIQSDQWVYIH